MELQQYTQIIQLMTRQNELLEAQYVLWLFVLGVASAVFVLVLLYKFIRLFC